jgi:hypothetical protein
MREPDDLLCEMCGIGSRRYQGQLHQESCIDCVAHDFEVRLPVEGLYQGFWRDNDEWATLETPWNIVPQAAHENVAPYPWETWIDEAPIGRVYAGW